MKEYFAATGHLIEAQGNHPVMLSAGTRVYLVDEGQVDIFAVCGRQLQDTNARHHLARIETGGLFFESGLPQEALHLIAVGATGTRIWALDRELWLPAAQAEDHAQSAVALFDHWVQTLGAGLGIGPVPRKAALFDAAGQLNGGRQLKLSADEVLRAGGSVVWVNACQGRLLLMGRPELVIDSGRPPVALSAHIWLSSTTEALVSGLESRVFIQQPTFWNDLDAFGQLMMRSLALKLKLADASERERLQVKARQDRRAVQQALAGLGRIMNSGLDEPCTPEVVDPLLAACRLIGSRSGIDFKQLPATETQWAIDPLTAISRSSGVRVRQVMLRDGWYNADNGPLLGFREQDGSPVALLVSAKQRYLLHDPTDGSRRPIDAQIAGTLKPQAYMFYRPLPAKKIFWREFFTFGLQHCTKDILMIILMGLGGSLLGLLVPIFTGILFDTIIPSAAEGQVAQIAFILLTCALATAMFEITKGLALLRIETRMDTSLQSALWDRLLNLPATFFRQYTAGDLTNRSMGLNVIRQILSGVTMTTILSGIFSLLNFGLLFYYQWRLALVAAALVFFSLIVTGSASYVKVRYQSRVNDIQGKLSGLVLQFITGIAKLRVSGTEGRAFSIWATKFGEQKLLAVKAGRVDNLLACFNSIFPIMASMAIFAWVAFKSLSILSVGDFMAFNAAYIGFQYAMIQMGIAVAASLNVIPYYRRLTPILQALPESDANKSYPGELFGEIEVNHVNFRYDPHGPLILDDVSISARPGEFVALVGGSGSGKSTLLRLLMGFETPESGTIYYDGQDLATLDIQAVRHQTGVVLQNSQPMPGDLFKNIIGASNLRLADAWEAARMAGLEDDIRQMPMGMNTVISAGGGTLSGGQRQRLLIARAIVRKPRLLYFDEATSALDNHTQAIVSRSLEGLQTTRIVIAHRLSTIINADRIYVLDNGRILESGTYEQLMARKQHFYELVQRQIS